MEIGQKVIIKPYEQIYTMKSKQLIFGFTANNLFFLETMKIYCGNIVTLIVTNFRLGVWRVEENRCYWHEEWLKPLEFLLDDDFEI